MKVTCAALLASLVLAGGVTFARSQSMETGIEQTKPDSNATKKDQNAAKKKEKSQSGNNPSPTASSPAASAADSNATSSSAPASRPAAAQNPAPPARTAGMVWVNTESGIYHKPGTRWYGKTKQGKYMTEADAKKAGYHAAAKE